MKRILLVDRDRTAADVLGQELDRLGLAVDLAHDDAGAVRRAQEARPDVVLVSLGPASGNGLEVCVGIRTTPALRGVPLLLLASEADELLEQRALKLRIADAFVRLPIATRDLVQRIGQLVPLDPPTTRPHPALDGTNTATTLADADIDEVSSGAIQAAPPTMSAPPAPPRPPPRSSATMARVAFPEDRAAEALAAVHAAMGTPDGPRRSTTVRSMNAVAIPRPADATAARPPAHERISPQARTREVTDLREQLGKAEQQLRTMQKELAAVQSDRDLSAKRAADAKTRLQRLEAQRDEAREALSNLERAIRTTNDKHEEDLRKQRETFAEALAAAESAQREASRAADDARREAAKAQASLQAEERARQAKEQELARSEEARIAAAQAATEARAAAEAARAEVTSAHEQRIAATEDLSTHRLARVRVEQVSAELQRRLDEREKALTTEQSRRDAAERRAAANEQALQAAQSAAETAQRAAQSATEALAEATARHRAELEEARQAAQRQAPSTSPEDHAASAAAFEEVLRELESLSQAHAAALAERDAAHERALEEATRQADERIAARERALADQHVEEKKQSDARWMVEMQGRVLGAIEMLEADRGEALAALRAAHVSELKRKEAAWTAQRHELEREIRELAIDDAKKLDDLEEAGERVNALKAELSTITAERDRLVAELDRAQAALPAERARFAAAQSEWHAAREALKREVQAVQLAMQQALDRLLRSDPPPDE